LQKGDITIAQALKQFGYATAQFGKNHLGDRHEFLPTNHGFDEFYGNLYHLNAEEEPENADYPKDPEFRKKFGPRGVLHAFSDGKIDDTGPLNIKRMETIDDDIAQRSVDHIQKQAKTGNPFFVWVNFTHMHLHTHVRPDAKGRSGIERADITLNTYWDWVIRHAHFGTPVQQHVAAFLGTFKEYPPSQRAASFNLDQLMEKLQKSREQSGK
jgi:arylsulfatase A-like enzyme